MILTKAMNVYHRELMMEQNLSVAKNFLEEKIGIQYATKPFKKLATEQKLGIKSKARSEDFLYQELGQGNEMLTMMSEGLVRKIRHAKTVDFFFDSHLIIPTLDGDKCLGLYGRALPNANLAFIKHLRTKRKTSYPKLCGKVLFTEGEMEVLVLQSLGYQARTLFSISSAHFSDDFEPYLFFNENPQEKVRDLYATMFRQKGVDLKFAKSDTDIKKILLTHKEQAKDFVEDRLIKSFFSLRTIF